MRIRKKTTTSPITLQRCRVGLRGAVALIPEGANDFRRKCSEYTGPARHPLHRPAPAASAAEGVR